MLVAVFAVGIYWLMRRAGKSWWLWSGALAAVALAFFMLAAPILIEPLFNKYEPVPAGRVRDAVVGMAGRAGIPPDKVYMFNGSRQSNNFTANAGGVGSTARVAISDVAFKNATLDEVRAVTDSGNGRRILSLAGREADIVGIGGQPNESAEAVKEKIGWIREGAADRFGQIELNVNMMGVGDQIHPQALRRTGMDEAAIRSSDSSSSWVAWTR